MEEVIVILSDSDEDIKPFESLSKKRKIDSDSQDEYEPLSVKKTKKVKTEGTKTIKSEKPKKNRTAAKERKPKATVKSTAKEIKVVKEEIKNEPALTDAPSSSNPQQMQHAETYFEEWTEAELVAEVQEIEIKIAQNVIRLLDEENTIPFIARYRKELTNDMSPEKLRDVKASYEIAKSVKQRASFVRNNITKLGKITPLLEQCIRCARSINELDHIYSPYKVGSKNTLAVRARQLGLDEAANAILNGSWFVSSETFVDPMKKGLHSVKDVELGIQHIIADIISKDKGVLDLLRKLKENAGIFLETSKARATRERKTDSTKDVKKEALSNNHKDKAYIESKFENYFKFSAPVKSVKPYQVLAINRGENLKVLSVKINIPDWVLHHLMEFCGRHWLCKGMSYPLRQRLIEQSIRDSYTRLIQPLLVRQVRYELSQKAEHAAVEVFATNLKKLLLLPPVRGKTVLGIDPGFQNGCKMGITSCSGSVLATDVIYPPFDRQIHPNSDSSARKLRDLLVKYKCELIALGNGTGCRETESYLSDLIQKGWFSPLDVKFTIVCEQGASIYSCSPIAQKEFPDTDPNIISAVSLARRLQDPLGELVKVEPKHLGVGMYQHDVPEKQLSATLDEVVVECVSFVGVDVNTASHCLLRKIAGLNSSRAEKIIEWRLANGSFINRQQLKQVKGIGPKTFEQCAGFIRIIPETAQKRNINTDGGSSQCKKQKFCIDDTENPLDRTWIHPESYFVALRFIAKCGTVVEDLGKPVFISKICNTVTAVVPGTPVSQKYYIPRRYSSWSSTHRSGTKCNTFW
ncbi:S1 RNA-binding domain-containing protein 1 isoform X2 [Zootermopsis nevadensis]|uniref:S1 RNA-binding domain-containing protein 1 isoform X2 n=1 Tax=Zootermopsis nevadensis TaxID=136037 RepID=UPI000B8E3DC8|nr:S1 RNA-binding domain-containing protein 1 isoform X2 [Zootermopsis nevadensis]